MKKHRKFLVFYSLWLAAIAGIFVAFGEERPEDHLKSDSAICTLSADYLPQTKSKATDNKTCCRQKNL